MKKRIVKRLHQNGSVSYICQTKKWFIWTELDSVDAFHTHTTIEGARDALSAAETFGWRKEGDTVIEEWD